MAKTSDEGKADVGRLCAYFRTNRERFSEAGVKEAHVRQNLIDPFFEALGVGRCESFDDRAAVSRGRAGG